MKITYDKEADALYPSFRPRVKQVLTRPVADEINLDVVGKGNIVGTKILDASEVFCKQAPPSFRRSLHAASPQ